jgi:hypothetical protein
VLRSIVDPHKGVLIRTQGASDHINRSSRQL